MTTYYKTKTALYRSQIGTRFTEWFHPAIAKSPKHFPPVLHYLPLSFNRNFDFDPEEQYKIQAILNDAYIRNSTFKKLVDPLIESGHGSILIVKGFHETEFLKDGKVGIHFNITIKSKSYHVVIDQFTLGVFKITYLAELEF